MTSQRIISQTAHYLTEDIQSPRPCNDLTISIGIDKAFYRDHFPFLSLAQPRDWTRLAKFLRGLHLRVELESEAYYHDQSLFDVSLNRNAPLIIQSRASATLSIDQRPNLFTSPWSRSARSRAPRATVGQLRIPTSKDLVCGLMESPRDNPVAS